MTDSAVAIHEISIRLLYTYVCMYKYICIYIYSIYINLCLILHQVAEVAKTTFALLYTLNEKLVTTYSS